MAILQELTEDVRGLKDSSLITWVHGPSGFGKTAIAGSLAEILTKEGRFAASFFFRPEEHQRLDKIFITSIAFQLAFSIPQLQPHIAAAVESNPLIFHQSFETQMEKLVIGPTVCSDVGLQRGIIIDGIDSYPGQAVQRRILDIIASAAPRLAGRIKFLIFSRMERHIWRVFDIPAHKSIIKTIDMKTHPGLNDDIRIFLRDRLREIKEMENFQSPLFPPWQEAELIELVVSRSAGNFIFSQMLLEHLDNLGDIPNGGSSGADIESILADCFNQRGMAVDSSKGYGMRQTYPQMPYQVDHYGQSTDIIAVKETTTSISRDRELEALKR